MTRPRAFCVVLLWAQCCGASRIYLNDTESTVKIKSTTVLALGPQRFSVDSHAPVRIVSNACHGDVGDYRGAIAVVDLHMPQCRFETIYTRLVLGGVVAVLAHSPFSPPGVNYYTHDGFHGFPTKFMEVPLLEVSSRDADLVLAQRDERGRVRVRLRPTRNAWRAMWTGWLWITVMRCVLPAWCAFISQRAARTLRSLLLEDGDVLCTVSGVVLLLECAVMLVLCVAFALGAGTWSSPHVSDQLNFFFLSGLQGAAVFTSLAMAVFWQRRFDEARRGLATRTRRRDSSLFWVQVIGVFFLVTITPDIVQSVLLTTYQYSEQGAVYVIVVSMAMNVCAALFFLVTTRGFFCAVVSERVRALSARWRAWYRGSGLLVPRRTRSEEEGQCGILSSPSSASCESLGQQLAADGEESPCESYDNGHPAAAARISVAEADAEASIDPLVGELNRIGFCFFVSALTMMCTAVTIGLWALPDNPPRSNFLIQVFFYFSRVATSAVQVSSLGPRSHTRSPKQDESDDSRHAPVALCAVDPHAGHDETCTYATRTRALALRERADWPKLVRAIVDHDERPDAYVGVSLSTGERIFAQGAPRALSVPIESILRRRREEDPSTGFTEAQPGDCDTMLDELRSRRRVGTTLTLKKIDVQLADGSFAYFRAEMTKIDVASLLIHMIDVTEVVEVTQSVAREKARASSMVHHEIGNLLSSASACLDRVKEKCDVAELGDLSASSYRGFCEAEFQSITTALCQSMEVIHNTNSITRLDDAMFVPPTEDFAIHSVGDELASLFRQNMAPGVKFVVQPFHSKVATMVCGPRFYLVRALSNLIGNAIKFTYRGQITLSVALVGPDVYEFAVSDTGRGIAPDKLESIVQYGGQACSADAARGWGVGLALVVKIVARLAPPGSSSRRNLGFDSTEGRGTTVSFRAWLPARAAPADGQNATVSDLAAPRQAPFDAADARSDLRLAVVCDDLAVIREAMVRVLERRLLPSAGWSVRAAVNGEDAIKRFPDADLVLMDFHMPITGGVLNGAEATLELLALKPGMIVVGVTANAQPGSFEHEALLSAGCFAVQPKPLVPETLLKLLYGLSAGSSNPNKSPPRQGRTLRRRSSSHSSSPETKTRSDGGDAIVVDVELALRTFGDTASLLEALPDFAHDARLDAVLAQTSVDACAKLKANAHALKGVALTFGCASLGKAASKLEQACAKVLQLVSATHKEQHAVAAACADLLAGKPTSETVPRICAEADVRTSSSPPRSPTPLALQPQQAERPVVPPSKKTPQGPSSPSKRSAPRHSSKEFSLAPSLSQLVACSSANNGSGPIVPPEVVVVDALVVDDQRVVRTFTTKKLERTGFARVVAVDSGAAAIAFILSEQGRHVRVVLMDKEMPEMDGIQTTRAILKACDHAHRPSIFGLTATCNAETIAAFQSAGATGVLTKPLTDNDIGLIRTSAAQF